MNRITTLAVLAGFCLLLALADRTLFGIAAQAQAPQVQRTPNIVRVPVPRADRAAPPDMTNHRCHIFPLREGYGAQARGEPLIRPDCDYLHEGPANYLPKRGVKPERGVKENPAPTDLVFHGGPVIQTTQHYFILLNCSLSCWGDPFKFLSDLFIGLNIPFIHVSDQYTTIASGRYATSDNVIELTNPQPHTLTDSQLRGNIIMPGIKSAFPQGGGGGYDRMYSIFLPQGQDLCFDNFKACYCPDNNPPVNCGGPFVFCAYHGSFDSTDAVGARIHVIYQAQPYLDVPGCQVPDGPNGSLIDSTNNVFSHEIFETITDPDLNAWWHPPDGSEIGDLCAWNLINPISLNGALYAIQKEYSNQAHQCVSVPPTQFEATIKLVHPDILHLRLFNLQIDGVTVRSNINGGGTGIMPINPGNHTVGETAGRGTRMGAFYVEIGGDCAADGTVNIAALDSKFCTITNYDIFGGCSQPTPVCCEPGDGKRGCLLCAPLGKAC